MTGLLTDVINNQAYSLMELTNAIVRMPHVAKEMEAAVNWSIVQSSTKTFAIDLVQKRINLLGTVARGAPLPFYEPDDANLVHVNIPRVGKRGSVTVDQIQDKRAYGTVDQVTLESVRDERLGLIKSELKHTSNFAKARALDGLVVDAISGRVLTNMLTLFGVAQPTYNWDLTTVVPNELLSEYKEVVEDDIGDSYIGMKGSKLLCGRNFFRKLRANPSVQAGFNETDSIDGARRRFVFVDDKVTGGFILSEDVEVVKLGYDRYPLFDGNGNKTGTNGFIDDNTAYLVPNADGFARTAFGPSSAMPFWGTTLPYYVLPKIKEDMSGIEFDVDSFEVNYFERPDLIVKITCS